jgi:hypothetical protein
LILFRSARSSRGISKRGSPLSVGSRWIDSDKVIFVDGRPQKFPGWITKSISSVTDPIRGLLFWATLELLFFYGLGTYRKLYVMDQGETPTDITPVESTGTLLSNPFTTVNGSASVTVTHVAHGRNEGDEVRYSGATAGGGITIDGTYQVTSRVSDDLYTIEHTVAATISLGGSGGSSVAYQYELTIGTVDPLEGDGYGAGPYGLGITASRPPMWAQPSSSSRASGTWRGTAT